MTGSIMSAVNNLGNLFVFIFQYDTRTGDLHKKYLPLTGGIFEKAVTCSALFYCLQMPGLQARTCIDERGRTLKGVTDPLPKKFSM